MIKSLGWMNLKQRYFYFTSILVFKCLHGLAPQHLVELFRFVKQTTGTCVNTRSVTNEMLHVPRPFCEMYKRSLSYNLQLCQTTANPKFPPPVRDIGRITVLYSGSLIFEYP